MSDRCWSDRNCINFNTLYLRTPPRLPSSKRTPDSFFATKAAPQTQHLISEPSRDVKHTAKRKKQHRTLHYSWQPADINSHQEIPQQKLRLLSCTHPQRKQNDNHKHKYTNTLHTDTKQQHEGCPATASQTSTKKNSSSQPELHLFHARCKNSSAPTSTFEFRRTTSIGQPDTIRQQFSQRSFSGNGPSKP